MNLQIVVLSEIDIFENRFSLPNLSNFDTYIKTFKCPYVIGYAYNFHIFRLREHIPLGFFPRCMCFVDDK